MYYIYGVSVPSILIESTDSMISCYRSPTYMQLDQLLPEDFYEAEVSNVLISHFILSKMTTFCSGI